MLLWIAYRTDEGDSLALWGTTLGVDYGFGPRGERSYEGKMMALDVSSKKKIFEGQVGTRHSSQRGFEWILKPAAAARDLCLPFLLTSNLEYSLVHHGKVQIKLHAFARSGDQSNFDGPIPLRHRPSGAQAVLDQCFQENRDHLGGILSAFASRAIQDFSVVGTWDFLEIMGTLGTVEREL